MNFIDISSWQKGLDLSTLFKVNPDLGGVVVKTSGGASYVQDTADPWIQWLIQHDKCWGFYHYLDDDMQHSSGAIEARFWVANTKNYFGHGVPFADYEGQAAQRGTKYLYEFLDTVRLLTGVKPGVYCSLSVVQSQDFSRIAGEGYPLWVAQYPDMDIQYGFLDKPWQKGSVVPFSRYIMHQYSGNGRLNGYSGALDLDKFYGTAEDWKALAAGGAEPSPAPAPAPAPVKKPCSPEVIMDVLHGVYGTGQARVNALNQAGFDAIEVQNKVNELYGIAQSCARYIKGNMDYLNAIEWILKCL